MQNLRSCLNSFSNLCRMSSYAAQLFQRHGVVGPLVCGAVVIGSVYATFAAVSQIRQEWGYLRKASRQDWKKRIEPKPVRIPDSD